MVVLPELVVTLLIWSVRLSFFLSLALAFIVVLRLIVSYFVIGFSLNVLGDVFSLIQIWLPFNLNIVILYISVACSTYVLYRLSRIINEYIADYIDGKSR